MRAPIVTGARAMGKTAQILKLQCDRFNAAHPVGCKVSVLLDSGEQLETTTRSEAQVLSGHSAVIWLDGIMGCYLLNRVTPMVNGVLA